VGEVARLLSLNGEVISELEDFDVVGAVLEPGSPFYAVIRADVGCEIRPGPVLIEMNRGTRYAAEIERAETSRNPRPNEVRVAGVLGAPEVPGPRSSR